MPADTQDSPSSETPTSDGTTSFADFLEAVPPGEGRKVPDLFDVGQSGPPISPSYRVSVSTPEIQLHCSDTKCNGKRSFRYHTTDSSLILTVGSKRLFVIYRCANCQTTLKTFALRVTQPSKKDQAGTAFKYGENPAYGPPTPTRLLRIFGTDRDMFLKGRRCENQGLGIGAFGYYRRVVENHKNQLLEEIWKVAERSSAPQAMLDALKAAQEEIQFSKAMASVKDAIPHSLLIRGQNPLTLLHSALSIGLHDQTDERCLELAHDVRVILMELTDRIGEALKDEAELTAAVSRLMQAKAQKGV